MSSKTQRPFAWSYSAWTTFNTCLAKFDRRYIKKEKEPSNFSQDRGTLIHSKGEHFLRGNIKGVPPEFKDFKKGMTELKKLSASPETDLAVARGWTPSRWDDWNNVWCRYKTDASALVGPTVLFMADYKTGKRYDSHLDQGHLGGTCAFAHYPEVEVVEFEFWYLDLPLDNNVLKMEYHRKDLNLMQKRWDGEYKRMTTTKKFPEQPNNKCSWCGYSATKNGPCKKG